MSFYPEGARPPEELRTARLLLRPLRATDVELDFDAVVSSREMLRGGGEDAGWPADDFTLEDNLADLQRHEREHQERSAFTYTVMNPAETECLGCVYLKPLDRVLEWLGADAATIAGVGDYEAVVYFWVRQSRLAEGLDAHLLSTLRGWLARDFAFRRVLFRVAQPEARQVALFTAAGLRMALCGLYS